MFYDWSFILLIPAVILALYAQVRVSSTFSKYSKVLSESGMTGSKFAKNLLDRRLHFYFIITHVFVFK